MKTLLFPAFANETGVSLSLVHIVNKHLFASTEQQVMHVVPVAKTDKVSVLTM